MRLFLALVLLANSVQALSNPFGAGFASGASGNPPQPAPILVSQQPGQPINGQQTRICVYRYPDGSLVQTLAYTVCPIKP